MQIQNQMLAMSSDAETITQNSRSWVKASAGALALGVGALIASTFLAPAVAGVATALTIGTAGVTAAKIVANGVKRSQIEDSIQNLDTWGGAFAKQS